MTGKKLLLVVLLFVSLLTGGGALVLLFPNEPPPLTSPLQPSPTPVSDTPTVSMLEADTKSITSLVELFYRKYTNCLASPSAQARGSVSSYCQADTGTTSEAFVENLTAQGSTRRGIDPVTCSQNPPASTAVEAVDYEAPDRAVTTTVMVFSTGFAQKVPVIVVKENNTWKVDTITCPR